ncbi:unnamed protein product [Sympodiomycopsis kandeliae]
MRPTGAPSGDTWDRGPSDRNNFGTLGSAVSHPHNSARPSDPFIHRQSESLQPSPSSRMPYLSGSGANASVGFSMGGSADAPMSAPSSGSYQSNVLGAPSWGYQSGSNPPFPPHVGGGGSGGFTRSAFAAIPRGLPGDGLSSSADSLAGYQPSHSFAPRPQSSGGIPIYGFGDGPGGSAHSFNSDLSPSLPSSYDVSEGGAGMPDSLGSGMTAPFTGSSSYPQGPSYGVIGGNDPRYTASLHNVDAGSYYGSEAHRGAYMNPYEVKHRRRTTKAQFRVLEDTFQRTPKPTADVRRSISEQLDMPPRAVQIWFQNRRAKAKNAAKRAAGPHSSGLKRDENTSGGSRAHSGSDPLVGLSSGSSSSSAVRKTEGGASPTNAHLRSGHNQPGDPARSSTGMSSNSSASTGSAFWGPGVIHSDQQEHIDHPRWRS